jgi:hypothetical protein
MPRAKIPPSEVIKADSPLRLCVAAALAFPEWFHGGIGLASGGSHRPIGLRIVGVRQQRRVVSANTLNFFTCVAVSASGGHQ